MFSKMTGKRYEGIFMANGRYVKSWFELEPLAEAKVLRFLSTPYQGNLACFMPERSLLNQPSLRAGRSAPTTAEE